VSLILGGSCVRSACADTMGTSGSGRNGDTYFSVLIVSCSFSELIVFGVDAIAVETRPHAQYSAPATLREVDIFMIAMLSLFP
jgi:hypothetical protein